MSRLSPQRMAIEDQEARALAQKEFSTPLALEAGAGTGKTAILTSRLISWCLGPGWEKAQRESREEKDQERIAARVLSRVAAITFTEAAASEMEARVARALWELEAEKLPVGMDWEFFGQGHRICSKRARALLAALDHLRVQTIHGFCLRLLARFPLEARMHPQLMVDPEGMLLEEIARDLVENLLASAGNSREGSGLLELLEEGIGPQELLESLVDLAQEAVPLEALEESPFSSSRIIQIKEEFRDCLERFLKAGGSALGSAAQARSKTTRSVLEALRRILEILDGLQPTPQDLEWACNEIRKLWKKEFSERLMKWAKGEFNQTELELLSGLAGCPEEEALELHALINHFFRMRPLLLLKAKEVVAPLLGRLYGEMRSRGILSFGGILRGARDLLASNPQILRQVRCSMDQLLVDEFQDTDMLQCEIIRMIALEGPQEHRPGLFVVGDPKQSIYGWRNADLAAYEAFLEELKKKGGRRLLLSLNFRSVPAILKEVERAVGAVMKKTHGLQPEFQPLLPCENRKNHQGFCFGPWSPVEYWLCAKAGPGADPSESPITRAEANQLEAKALAWDILRLHREKGVRWAEIGILFRSTADLDVYLEALREAGVPYWVSSDKNYFRRREILEATALVRSVLDPMDQLALVAHLRSCTVGVPDAAWIPLWAKGFPALMAQLSAAVPEQLQVIKEKVLEVSANLPSSVPGIERIRGWESSLLAAVECIATLRQCFREEPQDLFVKRMADCTLMEVTEAARYLGSYRLANLEKFFDSLLQSLETASGNVQSVLRRLRSSAHRQREAEEGLPHEAAQDAVRVMTIHKAKGLDFSHVYVVQAHKAVRRDQEAGTCAKLWEGRWELCLFGWPSPGYWKLEKKAQEVSLAETVRTLYVALTRAKDRLVIAGDFYGKNPDSQGTYASLFRKRQGSMPSFQEALEGCIQGDPVKGICGDEGVAWKVPSLWPLEKEDTPLQAQVQEASCLVEQAAQEAAKLKTLREKALSRMERPWQEAMSLEAHEALEEGWEYAAGHKGWEEETLGSTPAMLLGRILHRALEKLLLQGNLQEELSRLEAWARQQVLKAFPQEQAARALERLGAILDGIKGGRLLKRLIEIAPHVVARELPVFLAPPLEDEGPVGVFSGFIDLLYRDPADGRWVVADYKTDKLGSPEEMLGLCRVYESQGAYYAKAVQQMMGLAEPPRFELWFLSTDEILAVTPQVPQEKGF